jgi:hypothetical protein
MRTDQNSPGLGAARSAFSAKLKMNGSSDGTKAPDVNAVLANHGTDGARRLFDEAERITVSDQELQISETEEATRRPSRKPLWNWREGLINAQDLCDQKFPDVKYVVPSLFPEGVTLLAARPKIGKSWLLLQITTAIATGKTALVAADQSVHGDVLYLALEDNERRLQRRLTKYFGVNKESWPERLTIVTKWKRLSDGGVEALREWCKSVAKPTLIAIDTLKRVRAPKGKMQSDYDADYEACLGLQELAGEFGLAIIVAHHDRKMDAEDVFDTVSGTLGLTGGVDTIALIKRRAGGTTLHIEGRDLVDTVEKAISFDRETCRWMILGEAAEVQRSAERARVLSALAGAAEGLTTAELMAEACLRGRHAADQLLSTMVKSNEIERIKRGLYGGTWDPGHNCRCGRTEGGKEG